MSACPYKLPLSVGTTYGSSPDQIYDATNQAVLILYSVCPRGTVDEARSMKWNTEGLRRADYVVKAVNEHEQLVARIKQLESAINFLLTTSTPMTSQQKECWISLKAAQWNQDVEQITAKPVDRRLSGDPPAVRSVDLGLLKVRENIQEFIEILAKPLDRRKD